MVLGMEQSQHITVLLKDHKPVDDEPENSIQNCNYFKTEELSLLL